LSAAASLNAAAPLSGAAARAVALAGVSVAAALMLAGCESRTALAPAPHDSAHPNVTAPREPATVILPGGVQAPASFADIAERAAAGVVFIESQQTHRRGDRRVLGQGLGTGFVIDEQGLVATNYHVVANASRIEVVIEERRRLRAELVGSDPPTDVAVLRVEANDLKALPLGDSESLRVGDWVVAIGNPFGLSNTVSAGIVSAKRRTRRDVPGLDPMGYYNFLQTDASINPGNSGGPLLDVSGHVVGINTAINVQARNIGFAIPVNMLRALLPLLLTRGHVERSGIGISIASLGTEDLNRLGLEDLSGALVTQLAPGGAGEQAGLQVDDVVVEFGGEAVDRPERLRWLASLGGVGNPAVLKVRRRGALLELQVRLEALRTAEPANDD
jgi:serine protease Do